MADKNEETIIKKFQEKHSELDKNFSDALNDYNSIKNDEKTLFKLYLQKCKNDSFLEIERCTYISSFVMSIVAIMISLYFALFISEGNKLGKIIFAITVVILIIVYIAYTHKIDEKRNNYNYCSSMLDLLESKFCNQ